MPFSFTPLTASSSHTDTADHELAIAMRDQGSASVLNFSEYELVYHESELVDCDDAREMKRTEWQRATKGTGVG